MYEKYDKRGKPVRIMFYLDNESLDTIVAMECSWMYISQGALKRSTMIVK